MLRGEGRGMTFAMLKGRDKHTQYRCGNERSLYNNSEEDVTNRNTPYGAGAPKKDARVYHGKTLYGDQTKEWKCEMCNFKRDKYRRCQVFGRIAATHGYNSRARNERWGITRAEQYAEEKTDHRPRNISQNMVIERRNRRLDIRIEHPN